MLKKLFLHKFFIRCLWVVLSAGVLLPSAYADRHADALSSARLGDIGQLKDLLMGGVSPDIEDRDGSTLLIVAAREGQGKAVELILKFKPYDVSKRNNMGDSAMMLAALHGDLAIVNQLIDAGASVDYQQGWTPLIYAAFEGHLEVVERLLALNVNVNALAPNQSNALMFAARNGHIDVVKRLLQTDISLTQKNDRGHTAETWALSKKNTDIAELIYQARQRHLPNPGTITIEIE